THGSPREVALRTIALLEKEVRSREDGGLETGEVRERLLKAQRDYEIMVLNAGSATSSGSPRTNDAAHIRAALAPDAAMLSYLVAPDRLLVFTLTRDHLTAAMLPVGATEIEARVRLARQLVGDPHASAATADSALGSLSRWLLGSVTAEMDGVRRLVVVPHG